MSTSLLILPLWHATEDAKIARVEKIRDAVTGVTKSPVARARMRAAKLGKPRPHTVAWNAKIAAAQKGRARPYVAERWTRWRADGRTVSEVTRAKQRAAALARHARERAQKDEG